MFNNKTLWILIIPSIVAFLISGCSNTNKLRVAFTRLNNLNKGSQVTATGLPVGYVYDFKGTKELDTIFVTLKIIHKIKVPTGSLFYLDENLIGSSRINVEFSNNKTYLNSKDISIGIFRPLQQMNADSVKNRLKTMLVSPKIDSAKNK